ncbi:helix-turn-helix domain-containing protein [Anabaena catenula]|uniref:ATP-binding protein n=1 Tax=Anabaena catenula FACHB-362 TaxID=2692877 RepID=A0ABR8JA23_9NOST|nr:ATP-binding protein [Anabaena catenula]MBD2693851.1 ATP-binding protein [Anabaena catenula FACHB-362]
MSKINLEIFDLEQLPTAEDDNFEFKSSRTSDNELKKKLSCAVSGFANSGGGCFVAGVNSGGDADGGFPLKIGNQDLRDWVDQIVNQVEPVPKYDIKLIKDSAGRGVIETDSAVLLVAIHESYFGPHMAPDKHYYIRAGAHTLKAKHFIVDALWAKRHFSKPRLTHLFRLKPEKEQAIQLGILALTNAPAVDVKIMISPLPQMMKDHEQAFPLNLPLIDRDNPFFFDVATFFQAKERFGKDICLEVEYYDLSANRYTYKTPIEVVGSLPPITIGNDNPAKIVQVLEKIEKTLSELRVSRESVAKPRLLLPKVSDSIFLSIEKLIPELLADMKNDLHDHQFIREFVILSNKWVYNSDPNHMVHAYYFEDHPYLRNKLRILENYGLIYEITYNNVARFVISEELAAYLTSDNQPE